MRVLIAEDENLTREIIASTLHQMGHETVVTTNGLEAFQVYQRETVEVMMLDWMMPEMDGLDVCRNVRGSPQDEYTYIIMLTAQSGKQNYMTAINAGADDFLTKPFDPDELQARLRVAKRLREFELMKSEFVSMVSHQLRTPVAMLNGYIDNMLDGLSGDLSEKQADYLQEMKEISVSNLQLISDLLNVSRLETGALTASVKPVELDEMVSQAVHPFEETIRETDLKLDSAGISAGVAVVADREKTIEAIRNVVDNAVRFTPTGSITVSTSQENDTGVIMISDTGIGMTDDFIQSRLFHKGQILSGAPKPQGGCGLGLYIARKLLRLQNGDISASSAPGEGSVFSLRLPLAGKVDQE